jgi:hypothetical protein
MAWRCHRQVAALGAAKFDVPGLAGINTRHSGDDEQLFLTNVAWNTDSSHLFVYILTPHHPLNAG